MRQRLKDKVKMHAMSECAKYHHMFDILHFVAFTMYKSGNELKYLKRHNMRVIDALKPHNKTDGNTIRGLIKSHNDTYLKEEDRKKLADHKGLFDDIMFYHEKAQRLCDIIDGLPDEELKEIDITRDCYWK